MTRRLTILLLSAEYPPAVGGVGDYTRQLGRALIAQEQRVAVLTATTAASVAQTTEDEAVVLPWLRSMGWSLWRVAQRAIAAVRPEIVHLQYQTGAYAMHPAINLLPGYLRRARQRPRIVVTMHDLRMPYLLPKADRLRHWVTWRLLADADALVVTNAEDAQRLAGNARPSRELFTPRRGLPTPAHVIPIASNIVPPRQAPDRGAVRQGLGVAPGEVLIAYFGLLSRSKGLRELLVAVRDLPPRFRLLIIGGDAPQPDDQRYARELQSLIEDEIGRRVLVTGALPSHEVSAHLLAADLVVLPFVDGASYRRGSLLAALSHGCPTITTAPGVPLDPPLEDGRHVLLLPTPDPQAVRDAIQCLAADERLRARLSAGARHLAAAFTWPAIAARHLELYGTIR